MACRGKKLQQSCSKNFDLFLNSENFQNMQLSPVPKDSYGIFYKGDTYLIFSASEASNKSSVVQHIHLWIGEESTNVS